MASTTLDRAASPRLSRARSIGVLALLATVPFSLFFQLRMGSVFPPIGLTTAIITLLVVGLVTSRRDRTWPAFLLVLWPVIFMLLEVAGDWSPRGCR